MLGFRNRHTFTPRKRRKLPREGTIVAALDIGAAKTVCFIARLMPVSDGSVDCDIIGAGHYGARVVAPASPEAHGAPRDDKAATGASQRGHSIAAREIAIRGAVEAAENLAGERIREVHVAIAGDALHSRHIGVDLDIAGGFVTADDIADSLDEGAGLMTPEGAFLLHALPTGYAIDGEDVGTDPRGLRGQRLTTRMLGIHAGENTIANLQGVIENAGLTVASWISAPLVMARAVVVDDEKDLGVLVIDIGARNVAYTLYHEGRPTGCGGVIPGAGHITRDLAQAFSTPLAHAERQKILHGSVLSSTGDDHRLVDMLPLAGGEARSRVSRTDITAVVVARMEEIYQTLVEKIIADQCDLSNLRRMVITGGASQMEGIREHAERVFSMQARLGRPLDIEGAPEALSGPAFSVCAGALREVADGYGQHMDFPETRPAPEVRGMPAIGRARGVGAWLRAKF